MTQLDCISYCSVCTKGQLDEEHEIICSLTHKTGSFEKSCSEYSIDLTKKKNQLRYYTFDIEQNIREKQQKKSWQEKLFLEENKTTLSYLVEPKNKMVVNKNLLADDVIISASKARKAYPLTLFVIILCMNGIYIYYNAFNYYSIISLILILFLCVYSIYDFFRKEIFKMNTQGITIGAKDFIPWHRINYIYFYSVPGGNGTYNSISLILRIRSAFGGNKEIDLTFADMDQTQIGELVYRYIKTFKEN